jgi:hypothetical protein
MATTTPLTPPAKSSCWLRCPFASDTLVHRHEALAEVEPASWDQLVAGRGLYMQRRFLEALDRGSEQVRYLSFERDGALVGVARFELARFTGPGVLPLLGERRWARLAAQSVGLDEPVETTAWICGSAFTGGEHGFAFSPEVEPAEALKLLGRAVDKLQAELSAPNLLFKEFVGESPLALQALGCTEMEGGHRMVLDLDPAWGSYADYLGSLRSKFRVKARRADSMSRALEVRDLALEEIWPHQDRMQVLLDQVCAKAEFQLGCIRVAALAQLRSSLGDEMVVRGYFLDGELVGFLSAFVVGDTLDAHLVGLDYEVSRPHGVYPRMLVDFLRLGLDLGLERVDYGRTAEAIKASLGAEPVPTKVWLRHRSAFVNPLLGLVAEAVNPELPELRSPFKA